MTPPQHEMLRSLVGDPDLFLRDHWQQRPLHLSSTVSASSPWWLSLQDVARAINNPMLRAPFFLMTRDGAPVPAPRITRTSTVAGVQVTDLAYAQGIASEFCSGATLVLRAVAEQIPRIGAPCAQLSRELGTPVIAHLFMTPTAARGFGWHRDSEDVLVVQLAGRKSWETVPDERIDGERGVVPETETDFAPNHVVPFELREGDVLYVPSGCPHRAMSHRSSASMHLSVGIKRSEWTRVVNRTLMSAIDSMPRFAPLNPTAATARAWLHQLGATAAAGVHDLLPKAQEHALPDPGLIAEALRAQFPRPTGD